ncbi:MAG: transcription termination factor NusA [Thermoguttaceae bacterium]|nr:transcription termination factor NusA [Thermoguttaceae bacterium]
MANEINVPQTVEQICNSHNLDREEVILAIEESFQKGAEKSGKEGMFFRIDRKSCEVSAFRNGVPYPMEELNNLIGINGTSTVRSTLMQKINELVVEKSFQKCNQLLNQLVRGTVIQSNGRPGRPTIVRLDNGCEAILPHGEKIPVEGGRENFRQDDHIYALVIGVVKNGNRVKTTLSRTRPLFVKRLFEEMIPDIKSGVVEIKALSRDPGHRSKIAVATDDPKIDVIGACIGYRGQLIREINDVLRHEKVDVIPWSDNIQRLIALALQPADVDEVILCEKLGRAIVLVPRDQRSPAIGKQGENVRLATRLVEWDINIMLREELQDKLNQAQAQFNSIEGVSEKLADGLVGEGFLSYADLSLIETDDLVEIGGISPDEAEAIIEIADERAQVEEQEEEARRAKKREERAREGGYRQQVPPTGDLPDAVSAPNDIPADNQPASDQPASDQPTDDQPTDDQPASDQPTESQSPENPSAPADDDSEGAARE